MSAQGAATNQVSLTTSPIKHQEGVGRKSGHKRKSTPTQSGQKKVKQGANLIMAGPSYGLAQFKMQKGSLANQILAVSRPQTQQNRGGNTRDEFKRRREDEIKALYA
jgi:hypothetical protein